MSDNKSENKPTETKDKKEDVDEELSELLESALEDFKEKPTKDDKAKDTDLTTGTAAQQPETEQLVLEEWNEEFIRQAAAQFESNLAHLLQGDGQPGTETQANIEETFRNMAGAAQQALANPTATSESSNAFAASISQTLQGLSQGAENLNNSDLEQDVLNMFSGQAGQNAFLPFMQGMMQSLLSKDVLYPSLKDIIDRYPAWLESNKDKITAEDAERYGKQQKLMEEVCGVLETEKEDDAPEVKTQRFEKVLGLMQKLQDYGQPPTDLVGDVGPPLPDLGAASTEQCCLM